MKMNCVLDTLKRARRALDSLTQIEILDEWRFDNDLDVWYLRIGVLGEEESAILPMKSQWYITVESQYPMGKVKVYPDVDNGLKATLFHQANNSKVEKNGLWRKGALCLDVNTIPKFQPEPYDVDYRLLYHVKRSIAWIELAAKGELVAKDEPFELPEFSLSDPLKRKFVFSEDTVSYLQWESTECRFGIAELDVYKSKPFIYYVKSFKSLNNSVQHYTDWGAQLKKVCIEEPVIAPWILLNQVPVVNEWQAPETFNELVLACKAQNINIMEILQRLIPQIRDGKRHFLLIGFPIPRTFGGELESICWKALYLPSVSYGTLTASGFRNNEKGWWMRDKLKIFKKDMELEWTLSENWNQQEITQRGKMNDLIIRQRILIIGAGCMGSSIAEIFVRAGVYNLSVADLDLFEVGNLSRHVLNMNNIGNCKQIALCDYLNSLNPHARVKAISMELSNDIAKKTNIDLEKFDIIIDCTGENNVLKILQGIEFEREHIIASISVGLGAKRLYVAMMKGKKCCFKDFFELISPFLEEERPLYDDFDLPRNGIGCWHPTFPGRSDDVWLAAATSVKVIEKYIASQSQNTISLVYGQEESGSLFGGYKLMDKRECEKVDFSG